MAHLQIISFLVGVVLFYLGPFYFYYRPKMRGVFFEFVGLLLYVFSFISLFPLASHFPTSLLLRVVIIILPVLLWFLGRAAAKEEEKMP